MKTFLIVSLAVLLAACKNQDTDKVPQFPTDLHLVKVNKKTGIRLFINKIEIKDQAVIHQFIAGTNNFGIQSESVVGDEKIHFFSPDTVSIDNMENKRVVTNKGNQFLFHSLSPGYMTSEWAKLIGNMNKHRTEPGPPRYDGKFAVNSVTVGYGNYSEIEMPVFNYKLVKAHKVDDYFGWGAYLFRSVNTGKVFNEFDETYINSLTKTDTLAIEQYSYTFKTR